MRGDRPPSSNTSVMIASAAPHARGSTPQRERDRRGITGCPACAGIDPSRRVSVPTARRLPRMRGDRPCAVTGRSLSSRAAPHARGSTRHDAQGEGRQAGCPACAGIDPTGRRADAITARLPRMRGDRPEILSTLQFHTAAAPHARGSTPDQGDGRSARAGCPACAGIDPRSLSRCLSRARLPRMRGDRPPSSNTSVMIASAAPHARGSTQCRQPAGETVDGCPACAGIDPIRRGFCNLKAWLPRMRGDRPRSSATVKRSWPAAPHARGSTLQREHRARCAAGCPACAGIDPRRRAGARRVRGLPRMRGDRPTRW